MTMISTSMGSAALMTVLQTVVWEMNDVPRLPCRTFLIQTKYCSRSVC
jgi:hypothetical protein